MPETTTLDPVALRAAMAQLQQLEKAEREAAAVRELERQNEQARQRSQRVNEAMDRVKAALARYDEGATAVREAMRKVLIAERVLRSTPGSGIQGDVLVPPPIRKVHVPSLAWLKEKGWGWGWGFSTTEETFHELLGDQ